MENKNSYKKIIALLIIMIIVMIVGFGLLFYYDKIGLKTDKVSLNYTETNTKIKEGIYITDVSEVVENAMPSIVSITSKTLVTSGRYGPSYFSEKQYSEGAGSGIIISISEKELMILTNNHVVEGADKLSVKFIDDTSIDATIKGTSSKKDIAIISIDINKLKDKTLKKIKIATIGDSSKLKVGNGVIAIGNALGYGQSVTTGVVSALDRKVTIDTYSNKMIQIDAAINGGNSGGALLNNKGEVVGINSIKYSSSYKSSSASIEGMGFAIPITDIKDLIDELMTGKYEEEQTPVLGVEGYIVTEELSNDNNMPEGFYISNVIVTSGAYKAGLEKGNIITRIEDKKISKLDDIKKILESKKIGDKITIEVAYKDGESYQEKQMKITLS